MATPPLTAAARSNTSSTLSGKTGTAIPNSLNLAMPPSGYINSLMCVNAASVCFASFHACRLLGPHSCFPSIVSQPMKSISFTSSSLLAKQPSTAISGAWFPSKNAVSISTPLTLPLATPSRIITQSNGAGLCRRVSQPSYHAPAWVYTPGFRTGGVGVVRLEASANHSSEHDKIQEPSGFEMRSRMKQEC